MLVNPSSQRAVFAFVAFCRIWRGEVLRHGNVASAGGSVADAGFAALGGDADPRAVSAAAVVDDADPRARAVAAAGGA